ncbi:MAG: hypothetical protein BGN85_05490 [Alphaproteobacteria bacterium 64-11]|nr:group III truncated hemoglobin [Alphaproteobacteria bacterium]OJU08865.1 MAG: hypothetical protein BGN85_05490 [Alphaproteobacteria bacterium 64-11]
MRSENPRRRPAHPAIDEKMVQQLVHRFYAHIRADAELGPIFNKAIGTDWDAHLDKMCDFWSSVMLMTGRYKGNPMVAHMRLKVVRPAHFERWLTLFRQTSQEVCPPEISELFIGRAENIARSLQLGMFFKPGRAATTATEEPVPCAEQSRNGHGNLKLVEEEFHMSTTAARRTAESPPAQAATTATVPPALKVVASPPIESMMHPHVYRIALGFWAVFLAIFWATFWVSTNALFMVVISTFYAVMFFGTPYVMLRQVPGRTTAKGPLRMFLEQPFATIDGSISGYEALLQVILVPACLILGSTAIGFIIHCARSIH